MSKQRKKNRAKLPVEALQPSEEAALNRAFYATDPADFLRRRLRYLIQIAASTDSEERSEERTYTLGKLELTTPSVRDEPADERGRERYVAVETEMLLHHAAETLLRMFIAHRDVPAVPWLELTKLRGLGEFKKEIRKVASATDVDALRVHVAQTWTGRAAPPESDAQAWTTAVGRITHYLSFFSELLLGRSGPFNAAKHGLAIQPGDSAIRLQGVKGMEASGPSLAYLGESVSDGKRFIVVKNRWLDIERDLSLVYVISQLLDGLWSVARVRYVKWPIPDDGLAVGPAVDLSDLLQASQTELQRETGIHLEEITFPPTMFSPPGSGADALRPEAGD